MRSIQGASTGHWIVLGVGAGFHLRALIEMFPNDDFLFLDFDASVELNAPVGRRRQVQVLSPQFDSNLVFNELILPRLNQGFRILSFKASWASLEMSFQRLETLCLGGHGECNPLIGADAGLRKAFFNVAPQLEINIKTLTEEPVSPVTLRWKRLRALRELIS